MDFTFEAPLWRWQGEAAWHFVSLPEAVTDEIEDSPIPRGGFGSVRVEVRIGASIWRTSIFPDTASGTFILPVKKPVRTKEGMAEGDVVTVHLSTVE
jgi:hypothetical protein